MGTQLSLSKGAQPSPSFRPIPVAAKWHAGMPTCIPPPKKNGPRLLWPNGCMDQDSTWHGGRPQPRRLCVRWGPPPQKGGAAKSPRQFSALVYCGQTAGWIKIAFRTEVGLSPGDFALDGDPALHSPKRGPSQFSAHIYCGQTAGCIKGTLC